MREIRASLLLGHREAQRAFPGVPMRNIVLALLATLTPEPHWDGCLVYEGASPEGESRTVCIGIQGAAADEIQERLNEGFERVGIVVLKLFEGGPEPTEVVAQARPGRWSESNGSVSA